jgi:hypothetical protein
MHDGLCFVALHVGGYCTCSRAARLCGVIHHAALHRRQHDESDSSKDQGVLRSTLHPSAVTIPQFYFVDALQQDGPAIE